VDRYDLKQYRELYGTPEAVNGLHPGMKGTVEVK
jgi:hypothetical protein